MNGPVTKERRNAFRRAERKRRGEYVWKKQNGLEWRKQRTSCLSHNSLPTGPTPSHQAHSILQSLCYGSAAFHLGL